MAGGSGFCGISLLQDTPPIPYANYKYLVNLTGSSTSQPREVTIEDSSLKYGYIRCWVEKVTFASNGQSASVDYRDISV